MTLNDIFNQNGSLDVDYFLDSGNPNRVATGDFLLPKLYPGQSDDELYSIYQNTEITIGVDATKEDIAYAFFNKAIAEKREEAKNEIEKILVDFENNIKVVCQVINNGSMYQLSLPSSKDNLKNILQNAANNGATFSFADKYGNSATYAFRNVSKDFGVEILAAISDFELKRTVDFKLKQFSLIEAAFDYNSIDSIVSSFADIEHNGDNGWSLANGTLVLTITTPATGITVSRYVNGVETDVTDIFLTNFGVVL